MTWLGFGTRGLACGALGNKRSSGGLGTRGPVPGLFGAFWLGMSIEPSNYP